MKSLVTLHVTTLREYGEMLLVDVAKDVEYITRRHEVEGDGFLTITLPTFAKALERGLSTGVWPVADASSFRRIRGLPSFLRGFLTGIFTSDGSILGEPDHFMIQAIRQICLMTNKIKRDCTPKRVTAALDQFVATDRELLFLPSRLEESKLRLFDEVSQFYFGWLFTELENEVANYDLVPKHGPGAVAEKISHLKRWNFPYWTARLEGSFPRWRYTSNLPVWEEGPDHRYSMNDELPVRIVTVPKTQTTPRIIAIEPSAMQFAQQGLKSAIYEKIEGSPMRGILGFVDQTRNQELARKGSIDGSLATLDLSEASDRVHNFLVLRMLKNHPHLSEFVQATRSFRAELPSGEVIPLTKFASMGSALTFPIETVIFTIISMMAMWRAGYRRIPVRRLVGRISTYGDDIIVPTGIASDTVSLLEHFGFKINSRKSFMEGYFRESCGAEFFRGHDVSIVRQRREFPVTRHDAEEIASLLAFRNLLYKRGMWSVVRELDLLLSRFIDHVPSRSADDVYLSRTTYLPLLSGRYNTDLQREEYRVPYLRSHSKSYFVDGERGVWKWFLDSVKTEFRDPYTLAERPDAYSINIRWAPRDLLEGVGEA